MQRYVSDEAEEDILSQRSMETKISKKLVYNFKSYFIKKNKKYLVHNYLNHNLNRLGNCLELIYRPLASSSLLDYLICLMPCL